METLFSAFEIIVNISEPLLLFILLRSKMKLKRHALPFAIAGIIAIAFVTTLMNKKELDYSLTLIIMLAEFCILSLFAFAGDFRIRLLWPAAFTFLLIFSNSLIVEIASVISSTALYSALHPSFVRFAVQAIYVLFNSLFVLFIIKVTKNIKRVSGKTVIGILLSCVLCVLAMYLLLDVTIAASGAELDTARHGIIAFILMSLVILLLILFGQADKWAQKYSEELVESESLRRELRYNSELEIVSKRVRQIKHDYSNHMSVIASLADDGDIDGLRKYMNDYKEEYGDVERYAITGDNVLDSLLSYKKMLCEAENIVFDVTVFGESIQKTGLSDVELSSLFGNLIDNSINACRRLEPEKRIISLSIRQMADMLRIRIENTRLDEPECRPEGNHGLGLPRIRSIVEKHDGVLSIMPEKETFTVEILFSVVGKADQ